MPDADDTAKAIESFHLMGRKSDNIRVDRLITEFGGKTSFRTYSCEKNPDYPSLSANCNILKALLLSEQRSSHHISIVPAVGFICEKWFEGELTDKWVSNLSRGCINEG
jgi:hypothetical protein